MLRRAGELRQSLTQLADAFRLLPNLAMTSRDVIPFLEMAAPTGDYAMQTALKILPVFQAIHSFWTALRFASFAFATGNFHQNLALRPQSSTRFSFVCRRDICVAICQCWSHFLAFPLDKFHFRCSTILHQRRSWAEVPQVLTQAELLFSGAKVKQKTSRSRRPKVTLIWLHTYILRCYE